MAARFAEPFKGFCEKLVVPCHKVYIKWLNSVLANYRDLSVARRSIICRCRRLLATDKSRYFAQPRPIIDYYYICEYTWNAAMEVSRMRLTRWYIIFDILYVTAQWNSLQHKTANYLRWLSLLYGSYFKFEIGNIYVEIKIISSQPSLHTVYKVFEISERIDIKHKIHKTNWSTSWVIKCPP